MSACFTLLGLRSDGVSPTLDLVQSASVRGALAEARQFLAQHGSCEAVEVWVEGRRLAIVRRHRGEAGTADGDDEVVLIARIARAMEPDQAGTSELAEALQDLLDEAPPTERSVFARWLAPLALAAEELGAYASTEEVAARAREIQATKH